MGGAGAFRAALEEQHVRCSSQHLHKPVFEFQVLREKRTFGRSRWPYSLREADELPTEDPRDFPATYEALARVVALPWNEFYAEEHVEFIARAIEEASACLQ